jgi:hypothetical protein
MELAFSSKPGRRERHLHRRHRNPLFAWPPVEVESQTLLAAQRADQEEMESFSRAFRIQVQTAVGLQPNAGSDVVLALKEELEKLYEQACGLAEDHDREKEALAKLIDLIMKAVRSAADEDPVARRELRQEEQARAVHLRLLDQPLVADILHPESPIGPDELVPALLSAGERELEATLDIFDADQLALLVTQGRELLDGLEGKQVDTVILRQRLALLERAAPARTVFPQT